MIDPELRVDKWNKGTGDAESLIEQHEAVQWFPDKRLQREGDHWVALFTAYKILTAFSQNCIELGNF